MKSFIPALFLVISISIFCQQSKSFTINGIDRKALFFEPQAKSNSIPVIFVFHGHGGNAKNASQKIDFHNYYKDALVVFMEGIPGTSGYVIDKKGLLNGWQLFPNENENRDVLFFDEVLKDVGKRYPIDKNKVFLVGHSNGARFVNVLWKERGDQLAAIISVAAQGGLMIKNAKPISVWMSMGKNDHLVPYKSQNRSIPIVEGILQIDESKGETSGEITFFKGINSTEFVLEERDSGHDFPLSSIPKMVEFLKRNGKN